MDIRSIISRMSGEMSVPLDVQDEKVYKGKGASSLQMAEVYHNGEYYGFLVLSTNETGEMEYCAYEGKHPVLDKGDRRKKLGLHVQRDKDGLFRVDSNPTTFLGFGQYPYEPTKDDRGRSRLCVGFGEANCHLSNHGLVRENRATA